MKSTRLFKPLRLLSLTMAISMSMTFCPAQAQEGNQPEVSMVTLQAIKGPQGTTSVVTPKGIVAPLPGAGVNGNVAQIYIGSNGGYWYTDKNGQNVDLTASVERFRAQTGQIQAQQVPQYAPMPYPQQQQQQQQPTQTTQQSSGSSAMGTAAAAGLGAMTGAAITGMVDHSYYNAPYGTPMYYHGGSPYYYNNGERQTVNDLSPNQQAVMYNKYTSNQQQQAQKQAAVQQGYQTRQTNKQTAYSNHQANMQQQQSWYQNQLKQNPEKRQQWQSQTQNPFVAQSYQNAGNRRGQNASAINQSGAEGRSRFGERERGNRNAGAGESRLGGRFGSSGGASERLGSGGRRAGGLRRGR